MATRYTKTENHDFDIPQGYETGNVPDDFEVPSNTIEDVDKAVFSLFDEQIPFYYTMGNETRKIPVIFATGERFAVLRKKQPLRDENDTIILPLISILRSGINQEPSMGAGPLQNFPQVVKRRLDREDPRYQRLLNKLGLQNIYTDRSGTTIVGSPVGVEGTRRETYGAASDLLEAGKVLQPDLTNNIVETIEIPPAIYFEASYDITIWTQYTSQMNDAISAVMSSYNDVHQREFRLETEKGYWFIGRIGSDLSAGSNYDEFSSEERIVRYSFTMNVLSYLIEPDIPGRPSGLRSYVSAPTISFDIQEGPVDLVPLGGPPSADPDAHILSDVQAVDDPLPGQGVGADAIESAKYASSGESGPGAVVASSDNRNVDSAPPGKKSTSVGGYSKGHNREVINRTVFDPQTGRTKTVTIRVKGRNSRKGETVLRGEDITSLEDIID